MTAPALERIRTHDLVVHYRDGSWATHRAPPPGGGWRILVDHERHTTWARPMVRLGIRHRGGGWERPR